MLLVGKKTQTSTAASIGFSSFEQLINTALFPCSSKALNANVSPGWFLLCPYISIIICPFLRLPEVPVTVEEQWEKCRFLIEQLIETLRCSHAHETSS